MKIRFWDRVILFFGALLTVVAGAFMAITGFQVQGTIGEVLPLWARVICIVAGALIIAFGGYLIALPRKFSSRRHDFVVQQTDNGELRIAVKAIENLVQKCIDMHDEIRVVSMKIHNGREGVTVDLCISLANNISIPLAVASLQKQIKQYLVASSGIEVKEVRVSVETAQTGVGDSPYLVASETHAAPAEEKPAERAKARTPLHQRIFGKAEQPSTVPEPPREETAEAQAQAETDGRGEEAPEAEAPLTSDAAQDMVTDEAEQQDAEKEDGIHE